VFLRVAASTVESDLKMVLEMVTGSSAVDAHMKSPLSPKLEDPYEGMSLQVREIMNNIEYRRCQTTFYRIHGFIEASSL